MNIWLVRLTGEDFDIQELPEIFNTDNLTITKEADGYFAKSTDFNKLSGAEDVLNLAKAKIKLVSDAMTYHFSDFTPIKVDGLVVQVTPEGQRNSFVFVSAAARGRSRTKATVVITNSDGSIVESLPHNALTAQKLAEQYIEVADALHFFSGGTWIDLYKVYEIIKDDVGSKKLLEEKNWVDNNLLSNFTGTAQSRPAIGDLARHASKSFVMPTNKIMSLSEAKSLLRALIHGWLQAKQMSK